jgi:hypothetical protein
MKSRKKPRPLGDRRVKRTQAEEHLEGNVLVCHRLRLDIGDERLAKAVYAVFSRGFVVEAATYGRSEPDCLLIVQGLYDNELADTLRRNLADVRDIEPCEAPAGVLATVVPFGQVLPPTINKAIAEWADRDTLLIEHHQELLVKRMEADPGGDFIFPDLSPEDYAAAKARLDRRKS